MTKYIRVKSGNRLRCVRCRSEAVSRRRRKIKEELLKHFGGKCTICGYDRCNRALSFHHLDPNEKDFGIAARGLTRSLENAIAEAKKCVLVCMNCHAEIHTGLDVG